MVTEKASLSETDRLRRARDHIYTPLKHPLALSSVRRNAPLGGAAKPKTFDKGTSVLISSCALWSTTYDPSKIV